MEYFRLPVGIRKNRRLDSFTPEERWLWLSMLCYASERKEPGHIVKPTCVLGVEIGEHDTSKLISFCRRLDSLELISINFLDEENADISFPLYSRWQGSTLRPTALVWEKLRDRVFARDDFTCRYCGKYGLPLDCDHVVPITRGGSNRLDNLVAACPSCNRSKSNKTVKEWAR